MLYVAGCVFANHIGGSLHELFCADKRCTGLIQVGGEKSGEIGGIDLELVDFVCFGGVSEPTVLEASNNNNNNNNSIDINISYEEEEDTNIEFNGIYEFTIVANDEKGLQSSVSFNITFVPTASIPIIQPLICSVFENTPINSMIDNCTLHLENADEFESVRFNLNFTIISTDFEIVQIDDKTAWIRVVGEIDYESINQYILPITFVVNGQSIHTPVSNDNIGLLNNTNQISYQSTGQSIVVINIIDRNEPPIILPLSIPIEMDEGLPVNTILNPCLQAVDPDWTDRFYTPQFTMQTINPWIGIHSETGCLYLKQGGMDYENADHPKSLNLTVLCSDVHGEFSSLSILISLKNVNEPPHFIKQAYYFTLTSPFLPHSQVGYPLEVNDPDMEPDMESQSSLSFNIEYQSCEYEFEMNSISPILFTSNLSSSELGFRNTENRTCIVHVSVRDEGGLADFTIVYISIITSINPPIITSTTFVVDENPEIGQVIGRLTAISTCSPTSIYTNTGTGTGTGIGIGNFNNTWEFHLIDLPLLSYSYLYSSYLKIQHMDELVVQRVEAFDYEQRESIIIQVMAIDRACYNISSTTSITIQIKDVNEPPIVFDAFYHLPVGTNYPINLTPPIVAIDPEGLPVHFTVLSHSSLIYINPNGTVTLLTDPLSTLTEFSSSNITYRFEFQINVEDSGLLPEQPSLSSQFTISIDCDRYPLPPLIDFIPSFIAGEEITFRVTESTPIGERVGIPLQVDSGKVVSPILFFELVDCQPYCPVTIHPSEGYLTLTTPLDFEWISEFTLNVTVTNGLTTDSIRVLLLIIDESDCSILSIQPLLIDPDDDTTMITIRGLNLGLFHQSNHMQSIRNTSLLSELSPRVDYRIQATLMNERSEVIQIVLLEDCELEEDEGVGILYCLLPRVIAYSIQWSISWNSSIPRSIHHQCTFLSNSNSNSNSTFITLFQPINIVDVINVSQIPTSGTIVCFDVEHAGSKELYEENIIFNRNTISAQVILDNSIHQSLSSCSLNETNMICCQLGEGIGSIIRWEVCLYGVCDWMEKGMFQQPVITNITTNGILNVFGGDCIQINGLNFGNRDEVLNVYMIDNRTSHHHGNLLPLNECHLELNHTQIQCRSVEGIGRHPLFVVEVANQKSEPFISSVQYQPPVITQIDGPGSNHSLTQGGQVIMITGLNLGKEEDQPIVRYGRNGDLSLVTSSCHVEIPHTLLRCISVEGSGFQNQWIVEVANQSSTIYTQLHSIYGNPMVTSVSPETTSPLPIDGGLSIVITGTNFGNTIESIQVEYINEDGVSYLPECTLSIPHTQLICISLPGYGSQIWWNIQVDNLRSDHLFEMKYQQPILSSISCISDECGDVSGGDGIQLHGMNFVPSTAHVIVTYGFTGNEFTATDCIILSTSLIECRTVPGVGKNLRWRVILNQIEVEVEGEEFNSFITFSYSTTTISYPTNQPIAMHGRETLIVHLSNDLTMCSLCTFQMMMNEVTRIAKVERSRNHTYAFTEIPILHANSLEVTLLIYYDGRIVETTNSISIPTQPPFIQSYMITIGTSDNETNSSYYRLSLTGINFGYEQSHITVFIQPKESTQKERCSIQSASDDLIICLTIYPEGILTVIRSSQESNLVEYAYRTILFNTTDFDTDVNGYLQYPSLFHTVGGDLFHITGMHIPTELMGVNVNMNVNMNMNMNSNGNTISSTSTFKIAITIGSKSCMISHINTTSIDCIVPPGEGIHLPVQIQYQEQILLQLFASYYPPLITTIQPSILSFKTDIISIEGTDFGTQPIVEIHGILTGKMNCTYIQYSHSHSWIQFHVDRVDPMGFMITVVSGNQLSNSVIIQTSSPFIEEVRLEDMNETEMNVMPVGKDMLVFIQGTNLDAMNSQCRMNGFSLPILYQNSTQMICLLESLDVD